MQGQSARRSVAGVVSGLVVALVLGAAGDATASGESSAEAVRPGAAKAPAAAQAPGAAGFWFGGPSGFFRVHTSRLFAGTSSDLFTFLDEEFTLGQGAFNAPGVGVEVGTAMGSRAEAVFGVDFSRAVRHSEYRDFVGSDGLPILQSTGVTQVHVTGSVRWALIPRGRRISRLAWIPNVVTPYVGAGGGALWYGFEQEGEFVDVVDSSIFQSRFQSRGWTPSGHVFGGADVHMWKRLFLVLEARYVWASAALGGDFVGFEPLDLSGLRLSVGVNVAF